MKRTRTPQTGRQDRTPRRRRNVLNDPLDTPTHTPAVDRETLNTLSLAAHDTGHSLGLQILQHVAGYQVSVHDYRFQSSSLRNELFFDLEFIRGLLDPLLCMVGDAWPKLRGRFAAEVRQCLMDDFHHESFSALRRVDLADRISVPPMMGVSLMDYHREAYMMGRRMALMVLQNTVAFHAQLLKRHDLPQFRQARKMFFSPGRDFLMGLEHALKPMLLDTRSLLSDTLSGEAQGALFETLLNTAEEAMRYLQGAPMNYSPGRY